MKHFYFLLFTFFAFNLSFGQTIIFQESFETGNSGTPSEDCNDGGGDFFTRTDGTDITSSYSVTGQDGTYFFAAMDTDGSPCTLSTQTLIFDDIDISGANDLTLAILLAEDAPSDSNFDWDGGDLFFIEVDYDNSGTFSKILQFATSASTGYNISAPMNDTDLDGIGDGVALTPVFSEFTAGLSTGSLVDIKLTFFNLGAGDEDIAIDNIRVIDGYQVNSTLTITSPSDGEVVAPGTTNVDLEWVTTNLSGSETVDVVVNGATTNNATSPFTINTEDGQTYSVTVNLVDSGSVVATDDVSFSVSTLTQVANISALKSDVGINGLGKYYEISGSSFVSQTNGYQNRRWIQDSANSGILIYDSEDVITTTYNIGDMITGLKGYTEEVNGVLRLVPFVDSGVIASTGNTITVQVVTISELNNDPDTYESTLVKLENVSFVDADGTATFSNGTNYNLTDGSFTIPMRTEFYGVFTGEVIPSGTIDVTGVSGEYNGTAQVYARTVSDFSLSTNSYEISNFNLIPNPTNTGFVTIKSNQMGAVQAQVFDLLGKEVVNTVVNNERLDVSNLNAGVYVVKLTQNKNTTTKKLIIQ